MTTGMLGSGAFGGTIGGALAQCGNDVRLIDAGKDHVDATDDRGLTLRTGGAGKRSAVRRSGRAMAYRKRSCIEHVAVRVRNIDWHIRFSCEALGMTVRECDGPPGNPRQIWTIGGLQPPKPLIHGDPD